MAEPTYTREQLIEGLEDLLLFFHNNPDVAIPLDLIGYIPNHPQATIYIHGTPEHQKAELARHARALGRCDKWAQGEAFGVERSFGPFVLRVRAERKATCTAKVVGQHIVKRQVQVRPAEYAVTEVTEDVIEWDCPDSLLAGTKRQ